MATMAQTIAAPEWPTTAPRSNTPGLTPEQIEFWEENGYLGPLTLCTPEEMADLREWIDREGFLSRPSPIYGTRPRGQRVLREWHLVYSRMHWLCTHPVVAAAMGSIFGPDLMLWRSQFMAKEPRSRVPVAWHQDLGFPGALMRPALNPVKNISAWIAIDPADIDNGCVWVVPGTHKKKIEVRMSKAGPNELGLFGRQYKLEYIYDVSSAVPMVLEPGQFFLFNESTLHGSPPNPSPRRRNGIAVRVTTPDVKVYEGQTQDGQAFDLAKWACVMMSGEDRFGVNKVIDPEFIY
jgi:chlorinating enzyme